MSRDDPFPVSSEGDVNPKTAQGGQPNDNQIKDPDDWVTGDEPMTGAQASYLKTLSEQVHRPDAFDPGLSKGEASKRIDELQELRQQAGGARSAGS